MRPLLLLFLLVGCQAPEPIVRDVNTQEYFFVKDNGKVFMRVLPTDWEPRYEGAFMRIDPRHRVLGMDVILIYPRQPLDMQGLQLVRLMRRKAPATARSFDVWLPADAERQIGNNTSRDLVQVAPHTWMRPNEFRMQIVRPLQ